jgi:TRADD-N domain-containing protein
MIEASAYFNLLNDVVKTLQNVVGPGFALEALGLAHPLAPPGGVTDHDSHVRLLAHVDSYRSAPSKDLREVTIRSIESASRFLDGQRDLALRQARTSFNVAITVSVVGILIIFAGVALFVFHQGKDGDVKGAYLSVSAGVVSNIVSLLLFRLNREANARVEKIAKAIGRLQGERRAIEHLNERSAG